MKNSDHCRFPSSCVSQRRCGQRDTLRCVVIQPRHCSCRRCSASDRVPSRLSSSCSSRGYHRGGDSFIASMVYTVATGGSARDGLRLGSVVAALSAQRWEPELGCRCGVNWLTGCCDIRPWFTQIQSKRWQKPSSCNSLSSKLKPLLESQMQVHVLSSKQCRHTLHAQFPSLPSTMLLTQRRRDVFRFTGRPLWRRGGRSSFTAAIQVSCAVMPTCGVGGSSSISSPVSMRGLLPGICGGSG